MKPSIFYKSDVGKIFFSSILGLGLAALFKKSCSKDNCRIFRAPRDHEKPLKYDKECYKFKYSAGRCNENKRIVEFE